MRATTITRGGVTHTLYCADCREIIHGIHPAPVIITDPVWPNCPPGLLAGSDRPVELFAQMLASLSTLPSRLVVVLRSDSDPRFLGVVPPALPFFRAQILEYVMPGYIGRKLGRDEIAYGFGEPIRSAPGSRVIPGRSPKAQPASRQANGHPCSRALLHFDWLVRWWTEEGDTVLDPFMGSGTTGLACLKAGRNFIGVEIDPGYFAIACERLHREAAQQVLPLAQVAV